MPAITKKEELTEDFLNSLKRKDLLNLCKEFGIKCVGKNSELIEKILEHNSGNTDETFINNTPLPYADSTTNFTAPMTPQKKVIDFSLPVVNTPSSAVIKSIVQSARKTGLNSSPVRVPFALSPMAAKLQDSRIHFSPVKTTTVAKEPSLPIKEAFLTNEDKEILDSADTNEEIFCIPFDNKRKHDNESDDFETAHHDKREKLDEEPVVFDTSAEVERYIVTDKIEADDQTLSNSDDSSILEPEESSATSFPPSNFSTDLLTNLRDPELTSPELVSAIDTRVSRSEHQDQRIISETKSDNQKDHDNDRSISNYNSHDNYNFSHNHQKSSTANPLLPSGIIKLLEKKRQEKESTNSKDPKDPMTISSLNSTNSNNATSSSLNKKKFDLKESLKRPLTYKPHIGSLKPKKEF